MSLVTNITNLATRIATEVKAIRTLVNGNATDLSSLNTTNKTNLVAAINEVKSGLSAAGVQIDDAGTSLSKVWSSSKTNSAINSAVSALVASAPTALDTLNELAAALGNDASFATTVTTSLAAKADASTVVTLSSDQTIGGVKTFSVAPIIPDAAFAIAKVSGLQTALDGKALASAVGDTTTNFVTTFEAGLV